MQFQVELKIIYNDFECYCRYYVRNSITSVFLKKFMVECMEHCFYTVNLFFNYSLETLSLLPEAMSFRCSVSFLGACAFPVSLNPDNLEKMYIYSIYNEQRW